MPPQPFEVYLQTVNASVRRGNAREHTHRPALKTLLEALAPDVVAINEPARVACGAPDLLVERRNVPVGFIETKDVNVDLAREAESEQITRYRGSLANLVLTNYRDFRWYFDGELRAQASVETSIADTKALLLGFLAAQTVSTSTSRDLAQRLARLAHLLREILTQVLAVDKADGPLHVQLEAFRKILIETMTEAQFTDMYAQTITYGLFTARYHTEKPTTFNRKSAAWDLPRTNPFLRQIFTLVAGPELDDRVAWVVDCIAELLARADMSAILANFGKASLDDPVVHFYETFLAEYDRELRDVRGVYYTPKPIVDYIVSSVDSLLRTAFSVEDGLADRATVSVQVAPRTRGKKEAGKGKKAIAVNPEQVFPRVLVLDPAVGTGAFLQGVIERIHACIVAAGQGGAWQEYIAQHLLPRLYGFELLMAPYAVAHMKLSMQLAREGYAFLTDQRLRVYLTNTLEEAWEHGALPIFAHLLVEEARAAGQVKQDLPIMVVLGNPPYSGHSMNRGNWIRELTAEYRKGLPELSKPGQGKWLQDDYVKFIRFAQWRIDRTGYGILAYVTNHSWLSNPTFRGMRRSLMETFDDIRVLDLHGNSLRKEKAPDGSKDENVFDIQQGVAIALFVRYKDRRKARTTSVHHAEVWGPRADKYAYLAANDVRTTKWQTLAATAPGYLFVPQPPMALRDEYARFWSIADIFCQGGDPAPGVLTTQDEFAISWTAEEMVGKVEQLLATRTEAEARRLWTLCSQSQWSYTRAMSELANNSWRSRVVPILYRPFDVRYTVYDRNVAVHRRDRMSSHILLGKGENLVLLTTRQTKDAWSAFCTTHLPAHKSGSRFDITFALPLWLYDPEDMLVRTEPRANLADEFVNSLPGKPRPADVFAYIYAILHAPMYRQRYEEFLRSAFPRVPVTANPELFASLRTLGARLVGLHALGAKPEGALPGFPVSGSNLVEKAPRWAEGRVWMNKTQYFSGVSVDEWEFKIGGYCPAAKWLADRRGRVLTFDDVVYYQRMLGVLRETLASMAAIDVAIAAHGGWPLK